MVKKIFIILAALLSFQIACHAQNISAKASTDKSSYLVGDYINYAIQVQRDKNVSLIFPAIKDSLGSLTLIKQEAPENQVQNGSELTTYRFLLSGYDSASVTIPPVPIQYKSAGDTAYRTISTNAVQILVSTVKVNTADDIKDVKAPIKIPLDWRIIVLWIVGIIILLLIAYYLYRRYKRKKMLTPQVQKIIKLAPHEFALNSLRDLEEKKLWQQGLIKDYHSSITEIIRKYFEERFHLPALELTTSEALERLAKKDGAEIILPLTRDFLNNADMVKFAKFVPLSSVNEEMMKQAFEIVKKTIPSETAEEKQEVSNVQ